MEPSPIDESHMVHACLEFIKAAEEIKARYHLPRGAERLQPVLDVALTGLATTSTLLAHRQGSRYPQ